MTRDLSRIAGRRLRPSGTLRLRGQVAEQEVQIALHELAAAQLDAVEDATMFGRAVHTVVRDESAAREEIGTALTRAGIEVEHRDVTGGPRLTLPGGARLRPANGGFAADRVTGAAPYPETAALVEGYRNASETAEAALGFIFATETTDLLMVSSIGKAIERTTGATDNEWVAIHIEQEPDHVEEANHALLADFTAEQEDAVIVAADEMWRLWTAFFDRLALETGVGATASAR